jgi:hypothetical protein
MTPRASFFRLEGRLLQALLVGVGVLFIAIMAVTWYCAEQARPVLLELSTGRPAAVRPAL